MKPKVLILPPLERADQNRLEQAAPWLSWHDGSLEAPDEAILSTAEIIIGNLPLALLPRAKKLKWLQLTSSGVGGYARADLPEGVQLTCATGVYGLAVAEHLIAMMMTLNKKLHLYRDGQGQSSWQSLGQVKTLEGQKVLIVGAGDIGGTLARKLKGLGARVTGIRRTSQPLPEAFEAMYFMEDLGRLIPEADVVVFVLPETPETVRLVDEKLLRAMKKDALLLNAGRGSLIDQEALVQVVSEGHLWGVGLDVTQPEPLPADHPLWSQERILITPHVSGFFHLPQTRENLLAFLEKNLEAYHEGRPLESRVDRETGYRESP